MKSIIYILIVVLLSGIVVSAFPKKHINRKQLVTIQAVNARSNSNLLNESGSIIKNRLKDYGLKNFELSASSTRNTIDIIFADSVDVDEILPLLISKGKFEIYETYTTSDVNKLLQKDEKLISLLNIPSENTGRENTSAVIGSCKLQNKSQVEAYISKQNLGSANEGIKYLLSKYSNHNGDYSLYAVKHQAAMQKSQISETAVEKEPNESGNYALMIKFNQSGKTDWANLSKNNIGKSLAMVNDNKVYSAPRVMAEIKNGSCMITGNFTLKDLTCLKSLINNAELPLEYKLIK
jgi:SecD/SecF fusion protein